MIEKMSEENFQTYIKAVISKLEEKDKTLAQEARRFWVEIEGCHYLFNRSEVTVKEIREKVTKETLLHFFDTFFAFGGDARSKLTIHIFGNKFDFDGTPTSTASSGDKEKEKQEESEEEEDGEEDEDEDEDEDEEGGEKQGKKKESSEDRKAREERERAKVARLRSEERRESLNEVRDIGVWKKTMPLFPEHS